MIKAPTPPSSGTNDGRPIGWGDDELTKFFDEARHNQWATFARKPIVVEKLIPIDALLVRVSKDWLNPDNEITAFMLLRCHAAMRTAAALAMAGQAAEAFVQSRSMLEYAAYAVHLHRTPALTKVWLDRHENEQAMSIQKNAFSHKKVAGSVKAANQHAGKRFEDLYQLTIDFGGHLNERAITGNLKRVVEPGKRTMMAIMLHGNGVELDHALVITARCAMVSLEMLQVVFNARFELLGVNAAMLKLRKGL